MTYSIFLIEIDPLANNVKVVVHGRTAFRLAIIGQLALKLFVSSITLLDSGLTIKIYYFCNPVHKIIQVYFFISASPPQSFLSSSPSLFPLSSLGQPSKKNYLVREIVPIPVIGK